MAQRKPSTPPAIEVEPRPGGRWAVQKQGTARASKVVDRKTVVQRHETDSENDIDCQRTAVRSPLGSGGVATALMIGAPGAHDTIAVVHRPGTVVGRDRWVLRDFDRGDQAAVRDLGRTVLGACAQNGTAGTGPWGWSRVTGRCSQPPLPRTRWISTLSSASRIARFDGGRFLAVQ
jgi:hypothetical protein